MSKKDKEAPAINDRKPLGVTLAKPERIYRARARASNGDTHTIITDNKLRAERYFRLFEQSEHYSEASIECGNHSYNSSNMGELP